MRIFHYIPSIDRTSGGIGAYMQLLAKPLGELCELHVATMASDNELRISNCRIHYLPSVLKGMRRAWMQLLAEVRPDVVHVNCCWYPACALAQRWAQQMGFRVVFTPHGMLEPWILKRHYLTRKLPALLLYQKAAVRNADLIHATADSEQANLLHLGWNDRINVIPNGIEVSAIKMKRLWCRTGKILFLSRIHIKKGINFLLEAFAELCRTHENLTTTSRPLTLLIAGEGEKAYIEELKTMAARLGIADRVEFLGGVYGERKWQLYREADLFVLPTHSENFGIVVGEALASGTPVITTSGTPWTDIPEHGCGWQTEVGTQPTFDALREFVQLSEDDLERMGRNGRKLIEASYSDTSVARRMIGMYERLVSCKNTLL
ncbi:MAG: glycosyltransferase [Prevotella sp.]